MEDYNIVKTDFNEIAELDEPRWNHNNCYFKQLVKFIPDNIETCLEIGCGKGGFITETAKQNPAINYVAIDRYSSVLVLAMEKAHREELSNLRFINGDATMLEDFFAPLEFERIYINFCDPWPKNKTAKRRLTH
jgi:tRNA (guanine-N7-)-methyltransferase